MELQATKFVQEPNAHLLCSICRQVFRDPVINVKCGHTFCRSCLLQEVKEDDHNATKCPLDAVTCELDKLVVNR